MDHKNKISVEPIAYVKNIRKEKKDHDWGTIISRIELADGVPSTALDGIEDFSHLEIVFFFDQASKTVWGSEHPRENPNWPKVGIFAQRKKDRPNHLGLTIVNLLKKEGRILTVANLDAIHGTPVLDIKPLFDEYMPKGKINQPDWTKELMKGYWKSE